MRTRRTWITRAVLVVMLLLALTTSVFASNPTDEPGSKMIECPDCGTSTACMVCYGLDPQCESCGGNNVCATCGGTGYVQSPSSFYNTAFSLLPPVIAIALALITKEVYSSLFIGILVGGLLYSNFAFEGTLVHVFSDGIVSVLSDSYNVGILIFLVILGTMVCLMNKAGGSAAFGRWAKKNIKSRVGAQLASIVLGCLIFIDDYFNCLTVGSVMRPITDRHHVSRAKLAYIIDATAAPVCIIAPISSWAAAVSGFAEDGQGLTLFIRAIPYNFYALLSIAMVGLICLTNSDFGPMRTAEERAQHGDLGAVDGSSEKQVQPAERGTVWDMLLPIGSLIVFAVLGLLYSGGYWGKDPAFHTMGAAFGNCTAAKALVWASVGALTVSFLLFVPRGLLSFRTFMDGAVEGMKAMLPANIILVLAWTISGVCRDLLQTPIFVQSLVADGGVSGAFLPAIVFLIAGFLSFSTGTAWGTFGILIPIIVPVAQAVDPDLVVVSLSATLAGSVFGDHCSPISDTTILSSAGAGCNHIEHVSTQLGYACIVAFCCFVGYVVAGFTKANLWWSLGSSLVLLLISVFILHMLGNKRAAARETAAIGGNAR